MAHQPLNEQQASERVARDPVGFAARVLAVATAASEQFAPAPLDDRKAVASAVAAGGDLESRLLVRARAMPGAVELDRAIRQVSGTMRVAMGLLALLGLVVGGGAAATALAGEPGRPLNVYAMIGGVLGVQMVLLLAWAAITVVRPSALHHLSLAGIAWAATRWIVRRAGGGTAAAAAVAGIAATHGRGAAARWSFGTVSNGIWTAFNIGCLVTTVALLSVRQRSFCWESTILAGDSYATVTDAIAWLPREAGFVAPTREQIDASRFDPIRPDAFQPQDEATRRAWAGLLVGSVVVYGLAPRLLLTVLSAFMLARTRRRYRLDLTRPEFAVLRSRLMPAHRALGVVDADRDAGPASSAVSAVPDRREHSGAPALLALEITPPPGGWPPVLGDGVVVDDLGIIESREQRHTALDRLRSIGIGPERLLAVGSLCSVPDRGLTGFLAEAVAASGSPATLVLTGGEALRQRSDPAGVQQRVEDWRQAARAAGIPNERVVEIDLDQPVAHNAARLAALLRGEPLPPAAERRIEPAFAAIADAAATWNTAPSPAQQAELHRTILRLHGAGVVEGLRSLFGLSSRLTEGFADPKGTLRRAADRAVAVLPPSLRVSPRWAAAGAAAGALGCVAAAALVFPGAIASLPLWSSVGGAIGGFLPAAAGRKRGEAESAAPESDDRGLDDALGSAVRSAAITAVLLELQGHSEASIARTMEHVFRSEDPALPDAGAVGPYLDELRHRFDLALVQEARR